MTRERPILFSAPMVRAILAGTKTQTRRVCKPAQFYSMSAVVEVPDPLERGQVYNESHFGDEDGDVQFSSPYGGRGDRLWVRETWQCVREKVGGQRSTEGPPLPPAPGRWIEYLAGPHPAGYELPPRWRPSIHMPRWASRVNLEITGVRVERLQDISEADAVAEGIRISSAERHSDTCYGIYECLMPDGKTHFSDSAYELYKKLWEQINGPGSWEANPWVWVVEFQKVKP